MSRPKLSLRGLRTSCTESEPETAEQTTGLKLSHTSRPLVTSLAPFPTPFLPAPQTHTPDTSKIEAELEEFCRQLESSLQEDVECENLLKMIPEEEERGAAHPIGSSKFKQTVGRATTGNTILTTTHPKTHQASKGRLKK